MHSPEPMVVLRTRSASEGIPSSRVYTTNASPTTSAEQYATRQTRSRDCAARSPVGRRKDPTRPEPPGVSGCPGAAGRLKGPLGCWARKRRVAPRGTRPPPCWRAMPRRSTDGTSTSRIRNWSRHAHGTRTNAPALHGRACQRRHHDGGEAARHRCDDGARRRGPASRRCCAAGACHALRPPSGPERHPVPRGTQGVPGPAARSHYARPLTHAAGLPRASATGGGGTDVCWAARAAGRALPWEQQPGRHAGTHAGQCNDLRVR
jgi:hypothetical protein